MEDFETIYETDRVFGDYLKCKHCGERVERGMATASHHWLHCLKRKDGLITAKIDIEKQLLDNLSIVKSLNTK